MCNAAYTLIGVCVVSAVCVCPFPDIPLTKIHLCFGEEGFRLGVLPHLVVPKDPLLPPAAHCYEYSIIVVTL